MARYRSCGGSDWTSASGSGAERSRSTFSLPRAAASACRAERGSRSAELPLPEPTRTSRSAGAAPPKESTAPGRTWNRTALRGLDDLPRLQAAGADADVHPPAADHRVDALQVGQGALLRLVVGVAHLV